MSGKNKSDRQVKDVRSPDAGVAARSPDREGSIIVSANRNYATVDPVGIIPIAVVHPNFPVVLLGGELVAIGADVAGFVNTGLAAVERGYFDYVFLRDASGVTTYPQTRWVSSSVLAADPTNGEHFSYLAEITDYLYVGMADKKFNGLRFALDTAGVSSGDANLVLEYWNGSAWVDMGVGDEDAESDGTDATPEHMGQAGIITYEIPPTWVAARLRDTFASSAAEYGELAPSSGQGIGGEASAFNKRAYWVRLSASVVYTTTALVDTIIRETTIIALDSAPTLGENIADSAITTAQPVAFTVGDLFKGSASYDNADGVPIGGALGGYIYAIIAGGATVAADLLISIYLREDLMACGVDRAVGAQPAGQPWKRMSW